MNNFLHKQLILCFTIEEALGKASFFHSNWLEALTETLIRSQKHCHIVAALEDHLNVGNHLRLFCHLPLEVVIDGLKFTDNRNLVVCVGHHVANV